MSLDLPAGNLVLVAGIIGLLIFLWNQLHNSIIPTKNQIVNPLVPIYSEEPNSLGKYPRIGERHQFTDSEFQGMLREIDKEQKKNMIIYILTYFSPMIFAFLSLITILNITFSFYLFVIAVALTLISVFLIKFKNVGTFYGY